MSTTSNVPCLQASVTLTSTLSTLWLSILIATRPCILWGVENTQTPGGLPCRLCKADIAGYSHCSMHCFLKHGGQFPLDDKGKVDWKQCLEDTVDSSCKDPPCLTVNMSVLDDALAGMRVCKCKLCPWVTCCVVMCTLTHSSYPWLVFCSFFLLMRSVGRWCSTVH